MSAIISAVLKGTIDLIVKKGRDVAAEKLKDGDVTDQKLRGLIVSELNDIKGKLDALSQKDLKAAVDFFGTGLKNLNGAVVAMRGANVSVEAGEVSERNEEEDFEELALPSDTDPGKTIAVAAGIRNMQLTELDETTKSLLSDAQEKFRLAVENATHACNNEALSTFDRITAIRYRVMAAMLKSAAETVRTTGDLKSTLQKALPECEQCLKKLNSLPAVQNSFKVELSKGLLNIRGQFGKDERMQIISIVCQVNRTIYDAMRTVGKDVHVLVWPYVDIGEDQVDPLRDVRVLQMLEKSEEVDMLHYRITPELLFDVPIAGIHCATNTMGQFLIAQKRGGTVHVLDKNGMCQFWFRPQTDDAKTKSQICDLVTEDVSEKICLLIYLYNDKERLESIEVQVLNKTADLQYKFPVKYGSRLTVSGSKLVILGSREAYVYNENGEFDRRFEFFKSVDDKCLFDCTATYDGRILITHFKGEFSDYHCVHVFMEGQEIAKFKSGVGLNLYSMRFSPRSAGKHVVMAGYNEEDGIITVEIYTVDGKLVRRILLRGQPGLFFDGITVTMEGHIAVFVGGSVIVYKN